MEKGLLFILLILSAIPYCFNLSFQVIGSKLYDANGKEFIMRGINHAHTWFKEQYKVAIPAIAKLGANTIRLVLSNGAQWQKDSAASVKEMIDLCKKNKLIAILDAHDATGKDSISDLLQAAQYFVSIKNVLIGTEAYVIINIANEWDGTWESSIWQTGYKSAIKILRDAGLYHTLIVDAAGYGQYPKSIAEAGRNVLAADPLGNVVFSTHMYEYAGGNKDMVKNNIDSIINAGLCQIIGEFGWKHRNGDVDEETIMNYCQEKKIGWLVWSWKGNGEGVEFLDLSNDWEGKSLTGWGITIATGKNGIKDTSKVCSVFE